MGFLINFCVFSWSKIAFWSSAEKSWFWPQSSATWWLTAGKSNTNKHTNLEDNDHHLNSSDIFFLANRHPDLRWPMKLHLHASDIYPLLKQLSTYPERSSNMLTYHNNTNFIIYNQIRSHIQQNLLALPTFAASMIDCFFPLFLCILQQYTPYMMISGILLYCSCLSNLTLFQIEEFQPKKHQCSLLASKHYR